MTIQDIAFKRAVYLIYHWQQNNKQTNFASKLYDLMSKADPTNMQRFMAGFPIEFSAFTAWKNCQSENKFFKMWLGENWPSVTWDAKKGFDL